MNDHPPIGELGKDLVQTRPIQMAVAILLPLVAIACYFLFAFSGAWVPAVLSIMVLSFVTYGSTSHDLVHANLGLPKRANDFFLILIELLCLRSGTAYRATHLHHHKNFPSRDDVEASSAGDLWRSLLDAPFLQLKLWCWTWCRFSNKRALLALELVWFVFVITLAFVSLPSTPALLIYVLLVIGGTWFFPIITVYAPHDPRGTDELTQTRRFRGPFFSVIAFEHLYHLEHHMYPMVPRHHWKELARRLDPYLDQHGVPSITFRQLVSAKSRK
jgi:beta-carotene hydroxylase